MNNLWGIDLGGTKVEGVVLKSPVEPKVLFRDRLPTEGHKGYEHILGQIKKVVDMMEAAHGYKPKRIGIATPGTIDPSTGLMKNSNSTSLNGKPIKADLENLLGVELAMANDANCFALAEANMGVAHEKYPDAKVVFGVILGTGVGGGVVVDGKVINGLHGIGGEWGHNFLDVSGGSCYCGKSGCVEKVLAGPALEKYYASISGVSKSLKEVYEAYKSGTDPFATQTMERLHHFFGVALSVVLNILDPDVVVIGGGVGNIDSIYTEGINSLRQHIFNNKRLETPILKPKLGDSAGVFGAAFLVT
ncbi:MAG: ROK family protein [Bacteroidetes bacterium OLB12]|nr:MAG: ROK family protein [Bacteroidetes bacterium OLB12]HNR73241.1 ROK family protein [Cyclobacteriaceae bacterium]